MTGNIFPAIPALMGWRLPSPPPNGLRVNLLISSCFPVSALPPYPAPLPVSYLYSDIYFLAVWTFLGERRWSTAFSSSQITSFVAELLSVSNIFPASLCFIFSYILMLAFHLSVNKTIFCFKSSGRYQFRITMFAFLSFHKSYSSPFLFHIEFTSHYHWLKIVIHLFFLFHASDRKELVLICLFLLRVSLICASFLYKSAPFQRSHHLFILIIPTIFQHLLHINLFLKCICI